MENSQPLIDIRDMTKVYRMGDLEVHALRGVSLKVHPGEMMAIMGASGSGKSTLMNIVGALDVPTSGTYLLDGQDVSKLDDDRLAEIRNRKIGFVFQSFNLLPRTSALANVELPLIYAGVTRSHDRCVAALEGVGLGDRLHHKPNEMSGGQQQRVAIARALVNEPSLILADEPTGNLDSVSGEEVMRVFQELNATKGITIVFVTHEPDIAQHTRRIVRLHDGLIVSDETVANPRMAAGRAVGSGDGHKTNDKDGDQSPGSNRPAPGGMGRVTKNEGKSKNQNETHGMDYLGDSSFASRLQQAKQDLVDLQAPDLSTLEEAVQNAQDDLALAKLQQTLAEHDAMTKSERDLQYAAGWHQRRIAQLQDLVANNKANLEQTQQIATEQETLGEVQADLARIQAERQLLLQAGAASVTKAEAALAEAQKALADGKAGGDKLALAKAQLAVKDAEYTLAAAQDARAKLDEGADAVTLASAQADLDKKRLAVADAEAALAGTKLMAPFDGTVLQTNAAVGDVVAANTNILTLANLNDLQVLASVDETAIRRVSAGQAAQVTFDAVPGQTLQGQVGDVPLQGTLQGGVMVYEVPIALVGVEKLPLLVGMTANVKIAVGQAENALLVLAMALQKANGMYQVLVLNTVDPAGQPEAVPVEVGLSDGSYTQIVRGLNDGDKVVVEMSASQSNNNFRGFGEIGGGGGPPPGALQRSSAAGQ